MAEQSGFELSTPTSPFHRKIVGEFGEIFREIFSYPPALILMP